MDQICLVLMIVYIVVSSIWNYREIVGMMDRSIGVKERLRIYRATVLLEGITVSAAILVTLFTDRRISELGLTPISITLKHYNSWLTAGTFVISGALLLLLIYQMVGYQVSAGYRKQMKDTLEKQKTKESHYNRVLSEIILPKKRIEKQWFTVVSAAAGIGEEIVFRGFLFYLFASVFPELPQGSFPLLGALLFGVAHSYQGITGIIKTGLLGLLFGALYVASGSLFPGILLHFMIDFSSNFMLREEPEELHL